LGAERAPTAVHQLYAGGSELWLERVDDRVLELTATRGRGYVPLERIFCALEELPKLGTQVRLRDFTAHVIGSTPEGLPQRVRFTFPDAVDAQPRQWLIWQGSGPVPFQPPKIGERVRLAGLSPLDSLAAP
jgi:hypothetical protein